MEIDYCYIIDQYNKFQNNSNVIDIFTLQMGDAREKWCIPITAYEWGIGKPTILLNETLEAAKDFVRELKRRNGR